MRILSPISCAAGAVTAVDRKLAAILSADVAGFSRLAALDEEGTVRALDLGAGARTVQNHTVEQAPIATPTIDLQTIEVEADFRKALRINTPRIWRFFLAKHGKGEQADVARQMLSQMQPAAVSSLFPTPEQGENELSLNRGQRSEIQLTLAAKGFSVGNADGVFGAQTRKAIAGYQKSVGISGTGYFNEETAKVFGLTLVKAADGLYSWPVARRYAPKDFVGLETDARVWKAINCDPWQEKVYGSFAGHVYVVVRAQQVMWRSAALRAERCGGYLATIGSKEENDFVVSLFNKDDRFFLSNFNEGSSHKHGPWIGLIQDESGREPKAGWRWVTGEALSFTNWKASKPDEYESYNDFGKYFTDAEGKHDMKNVRVDTWSDMRSSAVSQAFFVEFE